MRATSKLRAGVLNIFRGAKNLTTSGVKCALVRAGSVKKPPAWQPCYVKKCFSRNKNVSQKVRETLERIDLTARPRDDAKNGVFAHTFELVSSTLVTSDLPATLRHTRDNRFVCAKCNQFVQALPASALQACTVCRCARAWRRDSYNLALRSRNLPP